MSIASSVAAITATFWLGYRVGKGRPPGTDEGESPSPAALTQPAQPQPGAAITEVATERVPRRVLWILTAIAVACALAGFWIWPGWARSPSPPSVTGGLLLLQGSVGDDRVPNYELSGAVEARIHATGESNTSIISLTLRFAKPLPDTKWFVVASGTYAVSDSYPDAFYCAAGASALVRDNDSVRCAASDSYPAVKFRFGDQLGFLLPEGSDSAVEDLVGYESESATVISGDVPQEVGMDGWAEVELDIPISTPPVETVGGNTFVAYPPIGYVDEGSTGEGLPLDLEPCSNPDVGRSLWLVMSSCAPVYLMDVTEVRFDPGLDIDARTVEYSTPDTVSDDVVVWQVDDDLPATQALLLDPFKTDELAQRSFLAGLVLSVGISMLFLLLEHTVLAPRRRSSQS